MSGEPASVCAVIVSACHRWDQEAQLFFGALGARLLATANGCGGACRSALWSLLGSILFVGAAAVGGVTVVVLFVGGIGRPWDRSSLRCHGCGTVDRVAVVVCWVLRVLLKGP